MTEAALTKALEIKKKIANCKTFCDDLMRMRRSKHLLVRMESDEDNAEIVPSELFVNDFIGIVGNEIDRLQKEFNDLK